MGRKPKSPAERITLNIIFKARSREFVERLNKVAKTEITTIGEILNRSFEEYYKNHLPDNNQTILPSFTPEGLKNLNQLEKACLGFFETRRSLKHGEVVEWLRQNNVEPKKRVEVSKRVINALFEEGIKIES